MLQHPHYWEEAKAALSEADPVMQNIIANYHGEEGLQNRGNAFETLCRAIVGQQISVKAADSVWAKFMALGKLSPEWLAEQEAEYLRTAGLSRPKVKYLKGIAEGFVNGTVHPKLWAEWNDEEIITELVKLPGIGRWTAEMFLIFHLLRPDVLPLADLGLLKGFEVNYAKPREELPAFSAQWQPYRTVATWYLWRSLDPVPVAY